MWHVLTKGCASGVHIRLTKQVVGHAGGGERQAAGVGGRPCLPTNALITTGGRITAVGGDLLGLELH